MTKQFLRNTSVNVQQYLAKEKKKDSQHSLGLTGSLTLKCFSLWYMTIKKNQSTVLVFFYYFAP